MGLRSFALGDQDPRQVGVIVDGRDRRAACPAQCGLVGAFGGLEVAGARRDVADQALEMPLYSLNTVFGVNKRASNLELPAAGRFRFVAAKVD